MSLQGAVPIKKAPSTISSLELSKREFPELKWAVPDFIPEGISLLCGPPKVGKSFLMLDILYGVATGGVVFNQIKVQQGEALYLALEDSPRRLQEREKLIRKLAEATPNLHYATDWNRIGEGFEQNLENWLEEHPDTRIVVIDTLAKIRSLNGRSKESYLSDYSVGNALQHIAHKFNVAIVVVHHTRKAGSDDPVDEASGTLGLAGSFDGVMILKKARGQCDGTLFVTGRDIPEENEWAMNWNSETRIWEFLGDANIFKISDQRKDILDLLINEGPMKPTDIARTLKKDYETIRQTLYRMLDKEQVGRNKHTKEYYALDNTKY
jgi:hypothetical protein